MTYMMMIMMTTTMMTVMMLVRTGELLRYECAKAFFSNDGVDFDEVVDCLMERN